MSSISTLRTFENEQRAPIGSLELHETFVTEQLTNKRYFLHGNSSPEDSKSIAAVGLNVMEGRATLSCNLVHAFDWAMSSEKRQVYSQSETPTEENSRGSVFVVEKPNQNSFGFANFTGFTIDHEKREIRGQPLKWASAYKQIGVFSDQNVEIRKKQLEAVTMKERPKVNINENALILQVNPSKQASITIEELDTKIKKFEAVDIEKFTQQFIENFEVDQIPEIHKIVGELVKSTIESIVITKLRTKALQIKAAQGYTIYNFANKSVSRFASTPEKIKQELLQWQHNLQEDTSFGIDWLDTYARDNIEQLLKDLG